MIEVWRNTDERMQAGEPPIHEVIDAPPVDAEAVAARIDEAVDLVADLYEGPEANPEEVQPDPNRKRKRSE